MAWALCGNAAVAEDAVQEAFARALERWSRVRNHPDVRGWIMKTALNEIRRVSRRRRVVGSRDAVEADPDSSLDVWRAVRRLPRRQQEAVILHYALDFPVDEVARLMGCRNGTVKAHLARARETLAGRLEYRDAD